jgi:hypothetical protein
MQEYATGTHFTDSPPDTPTDTASEATDSSDEFDWEAEDAGSTKGRIEATRKAKRGRRLYLMFLRLARPLRYAPLLKGMLVHS